MRREQPVKLFRYEHIAPSVARVVLLAEAYQTGPTTEAKFRAMADAHFDLMPGAQIMEAAYRHDAYTAKGAYFNVSRLWIPSTIGEGYMIAYYS